MGLASSFISHVRIFLVIENSLNTQAVPPPVFGVRMPRNISSLNPWTLELLPWHLEYFAAFTQAPSALPLAPAPQEGNLRHLCPQGLQPSTWPGPSPSPPRIIRVDTWQEVSPYKAGEATGQQNVPQSQGSTEAVKAGP